MSKILRALNGAQQSPWVVTPLKHSLEPELQEEPSFRNILKRSFYQKLIVILCLFLIGMHIQTILMIKESQQHVLSVLGQVYMQKEELSRVNISADKAYVILRESLDGLAIRMQNLDASIQSVLLQTTGTQQKIAQLNTAVSAIGVQYEDIKNHYQQWVKQLQSQAQPVENSLATNK